MKKEFVIYHCFPIIVNVGLLKTSILGPTLFMIYTDDLIDDVFCSNGVDADDTNLYAKLEYASDL